ncbi:MAG: protein-L-isoaspartate O-methyltransferase [Myxococcota bacterium]|nr:protein-L-isoaspartate O-methyltransferase [Myxococcota bacterium]
MRFLLARLRMVLRLIWDGELYGPGLIRAFLVVPRHHFVTPENHWRAYSEGAFEVCDGQPITCPGFHARMLSLLSLSPGDRVLDIGTGTGYQVALLVALGCDVVSVEIRPKVHAFARENLARTGFDRCALVLGTGASGVPEHAPYDAIIMGCAPAQVPTSLLEQLARGGRLVAPEGEADTIQRLVVYRRVGERFEREVIRSAWFVPMA